VRVLANEFLASLDKKSAAKVIYNIDLAEQTNDPKLFKKLTQEIWNLEPGMQANKFDCLRFGIGQRIKKHL